MPAPKRRNNRRSASDFAQPTTTLKPRIRYGPRGCRSRQNDPGDATQTQPLPSRRRSVGGGLPRRRCQHADNRLGMRGAHVIMRMAMYTKRVPMPRRPWWGCPRNSRPVRSRAAYGARLDRSTASTSPTAASTCEIVGQCLSMYEHQARPTAGSRGDGRCHSANPCESGRHSRSNRSISLGSTQ